MELDCSLNQLPDKRVSGIELRIICRILDLEGCIGFACIDGYRHSYSVWLKYGSFCCRMGSVYFSAACNFLHHPANGSAA